VDVKLIICFIFIISLVLLFINNKIKNYSWYLDIIITILILISILYWGYQFLTKYPIFIEWVKRSENQVFNFILK